MSGLDLNELTMAIYIDRTITFFILTGNQPNDWSNAEALLRGHKKWHKQDQAIELFLVFNFLACIVSSAKEFGTSNTYNVELMTP